MLRVGVLGLGKMAQTHHIPNLRQAAGVTIACLSDLTIEHCEAIATRFELDGAARVLPPDLPWDELDAVFILNRNHAPALAASLRQNTPAFVEKPACWSSPEVRGLRAAVEESSVRSSTVGYMKRYIPEVDGLIRDAHEEGLRDFSIVVRAGGLHKALEARPLRPSGVGRGDRTEERALGLEPSELRSSTEIQMERTVIELGIHSINLARALADPDCTLTAATHDFESGEVVVELRHASGEAQICLRPDFDEKRAWHDSLVADLAGRTRELRFSNPFLRTRHPAQELSISAAFHREVALFTAAVREGMETLTPISEGLDDVVFALEVLDKIRGNV